jgi:hypothetical protein
MDEMEEINQIINKMENTELHCGESEFYTLNKLHQPLLDDNVTSENLEDLRDLYRNYLVVIDFQDGRKDTKKIYRLLNDYISKYEANDFEKCVKIAVDVYDNILTFLNVCEEE